MANSFKQMIADKVMKRPDGRLLIQLDNIHVRPELNKRKDDQRTRDANERTFQYLMDGGKVPALEVEARDEGGVWIVEGHRRNLAYRRMREAGRPVEWIEITQFQGNNVDRLARIMTSNNQLALDDYEKSQVVKGLHALNLDEAQIAKAVHESVHVVKQLLAIAYANHDVQELVKDGEASNALVVARVEEFGEKAGEVLRKDVAEAKAAGKKKATKSAANGTFSATRSRRLCELLFYAPTATRDGEDVLILHPGTREEINTILNEYRRTANDKE